jgi:DNA-binding transcriptional LysR family regulator
MQTRALRTLALISQVGSFATAAGRLNMTLSAVSMQMKMLERDLDADLFDRSFRPPRLTPLGRTVAAKAAAMVEQEEELQAICRPGGDLRGRFRIGFVATASVRLLPRFLLRSREAAPAAAFDIETGLSEHLEQRLLGGRLDVAVVTASADPDPALDYLRLRREELVFAAPAGSGPLEPGRLAASMPFLQFMPGTGIGKLIASHIAEQLPEPPGRTIVLDSIEAIVECVKAGVGFTLLPRPDVERYADDRIHSRSTGRQPLARELVLATQKGSPSYRLRQLFANLFPKEGTDPSRAVERS